MLIRATLSAAIGLIQCNWVVTKMVTPSSLERFYEELPRVVLATGSTPDVGSRGSGFRGLMDGGNGQ